MTQIKLNLKVYLLQNREGLYFRNVGCRGDRSNWVADVNEARLYAKITTPRSLVTFFANHSPEGIVNILEVNGCVATVLDETARVLRVNREREQAWISSEQRDINQGWEAWEAFSYPENANCDRHREMLERRQAKLDLRREAFLASLENS